VDFDHLGWGEVFSDHMVRMDFASGKWNEPEILPFAEIKVLPSLVTLHYGQSIFEGLKVFRSVDGTINAFRPDMHARRLNRSAHRLCIPEVDPDLFVQMIDELVAVDESWVPTKRGQSLYIRPLVIGSENYIGVRISETYSLFIMTSPVEAYYKEGFNPVKLMTSGQYVRAVRGGIGEAKTAGNYAASLLPAYEAKKKGYAQVIWLDACQGRYVDEVGTMNICFVKDGEIITPPLDGTILPGVTRDSVIALARHWGITVHERRIPIDEVMKSIEDGSMTEVFGTGTAAVISPVGEINHMGETMVINRGRTGPISQRLYDEITAIQYKEAEDLFGWLHPIGV